ncbi:MAG: GNAT family N-acetyltransferase [Pseudonocardia sp.]
MTRTAASRPGLDLGDGWEARVHRADTALHDVADEWAALHARCPHATPFQTPAWLTAWWRHYGSPGALRLTVVRRDGVLVALGAFHATRGGQVLGPLGGDLCDWTDVLADPAHERPALDALSAVLLSTPGWRVLDLPEVRADAVALRWAQRWRGPVRHEIGSMCANVATRPFEDVVAAIPSSSTRQSMRRSLRKMDGAGLTEAPVGPADAEAGVRRLLALHEQQWRERGGMNPEHGRPRFARFLAAAVPDMVERGHATLTDYSLDGQVVATNLNLVGADVVGGYLYGARPDLFGRVNVTAMLMRTALGTAVSRGAATFSMLRGRETYKSTWQAVEAPNRRVLLGRPGRPEVAAYAAAVRARSALADAARAKAPAVREGLLKARTYARNPALARAELAAAAPAVRAKLAERLHRNR